MTYRTEQAEKAARMMAEALDRMERETGLPPDAILAGAHAAIVVAMVLEMGGPAAAEAFERAAANVRTLPSLKAMSLALAAPEGRA